MSWKPNACRKVSSRQGTQAPCLSHGQFTSSFHTIEHCLHVLRAECNWLWLNFELATAHFCPCMLSVLCCHVRLVWARLCRYVRYQITSTAAAWWEVKMTDVKTMAMEDRQRSSSWNGLIAISVCIAGDIKHPRAMRLHHETHPEMTLEINPYELMFQRCVL